MAILLIFMLLGKITLKSIVEYGGPTVQMRRISVQVLPDGCSSVSGFLFKSRRISVQMFLDFRSSVSDFVFKCCRIMQLNLVVKNSKGKKTFNRGALHQLLNIKLIGRTYFLSIENSRTDGTGTKTVAGA
jgi:hypothetical protein